MSGEYAVWEPRVMWEVGCNPRDEVSRMIPPYDKEYRYLIDVDNADPTRWSATAMYEILSPGTFFDDLDSRLTAMRLFVDMPAEKAAAEAIRPELQSMIDDIKARTTEHVSNEAAKDGAVSNILGAGTDQHAAVATRPGFTILSL